MIKSLISRQRIGFAALTFIVAAASATGVQASRIATIQGKEYKIDTLSHVKVGPGTMLTKLLYTRADGNKKFRGFFITSDMKGNDRVEYRMEIGNDSILTGETISKCAKRKTNENEQYFAGVNADFYLTWNPYVGVPNMACYMDGQIAVSDRDESIRYGHFFMDYNKNMWCDFPKQSLTFVKPDGKRIGITRVNYDLFDNELVLMNDKMGKYTHTSGATEVAVRLLDGERWAINKTCRVQVVGTPVAGGNMKIEPEQAVLSAKGNRVADIADLKDGDVITMDFVTRLGDYDIVPESLKECSGGDVVILKRGEVIYEADRWINARDGNNPRTMFGYTQDRSKMIWGLIDGRSAISDGCTYPEGADVMALAGCYDAVNVDGGGSAQMYVKELGMVNVPSDGSERAVSNGLYAVLKAPVDNEIAEIRFVDWAMQFPKYGVYTPKFYGYNKYGLLIDLDVKGVKLSCPESVGQIIDGGATFYGIGDGAAALTATYNGLTAAMPIVVVESKDMKLRLNNVLVDGLHDYAVEVETKVGETTMPINPAALSWSSDDASIAAIDANTGELQGVANGSTTIHGTIGSYTGDLTVTVEKPAARVMAADPNLDVATWKLQQTGGSGIKATAHDNGMKITYTGKSGRSPYIRISKDLKLWSLPDTLRLRINPGDAVVKGVSVAMGSNSGKKEVVVLKEQLENNKENVIDIATASWVDAADMASYPISLGYIYLTMGNSTSGKEYTIDIAGIETVYDRFGTGGVNDVNVNDGTDKAYVYPNPVNAGVDVVVFTGDVTDSEAVIDVFNVAGQKVETVKAVATYGKAILPTSRLQAGIYFVKVGKSTARLVVK